MGIAKVTRNFQVTIPKDIRRLQGIDVGDTVLFALDDGKIDFLKMDPEKSLRELAGIWKDKPKKDSVETVRQMRAGWESRRKRLGL